MPFKRLSTIWGKSDTLKVLKSQYRNDVHTYECPINNSPINMWSDVCTRTTWKDFVTPFRLSHYIHKWSGLWHYQLIWRPTKGGLSIEYHTLPFIWITQHHFYFLSRPFGTLKASHAQGLISKVLSKITFKSIQTLLRFVNRHTFN